ncbi:hypothetical protein GA0070606_3703 [Micromonospora citrea]|uniref:DUF3618 domain-containing protein n=1 Tax=Micromonospora citrea TaxID=47855 RepID=A0A1C6V9R5_9ACTN|nr:hypothetical protein [Micromonospora citrea]SCL62897.1 hypothetical protein GA0070606_3703 [Micromonospora citrea]
MTGINPSRPPDGATGTGQQARHEASRVGHQATQAGGQIAHAAAEQGGHVASEARRQARNLTGEATTQLRDQAQAQQHRAAEGLRGIGRELGSMAERSEDSGMAAQLVRRAADAAQQAAGWLDEREPGAVFDEVRSYARRHPGTFLTGAAVAGMLVGRLTRNLTASGDGRRGGAGQQTPPPAAAPTTSGPQSYERTVGAPYLAEETHPRGEAYPREEAYTGMARVRNASPPDRQGPDIPGGVAP